MSQSIDFLHDKRVIQRHIKNGRVSAADYDKLIADLPDLADKAHTMTIQLVRVEARPTPRIAAPVLPLVVDDDLELPDDEPDTDD